MDNRKMGNERLHFRSPNIHVCFKATINRAVEREELQIALEKACNRHPLTKCSVHLDESDDAWYWPDTAVPSVQVEKDVADTTWMEWYNDEDAKPFDFEQGPLVKIGVFIHKGRSDIAILGHHIIGDGIGYLNFLRDLLRALDGQEIGELLLPPEDNPLVNMLRLPLQSQEFAEKLNTVWRNSAKRFSRDDYEAFFHTYRSKNPPDMLILPINEDDTQQLLQRCKRNGITVNDAIASAFVGALQQADTRYAGKPVHLGCAASIRGEVKIPVPDSMGNYVTGIATVGQYDDNHSFAANCRAISFNLREKLQNPESRYEVLAFLNELDKDFIESAFFAAYGDYDNPASQKLAEIIGERAEGKGLGISNLGKQDGGHYNSFAVDNLLFIPPAFPANLINIGAMTTQGRLSICLRYATSDIDKQAVLRIGEVVVTYLVYGKQL